MRYWLLALTLVVILAAPAHVLSSYPVISPLPDPEDPASDYTVAGNAMRDLLNTPLGQTLPKLAWKIEILDTREVNAYSNGRGTISLTRGFAIIVGNHPGVWAAAIAHEMGHSVTFSAASQSAFEVEVRRAYVAAGGNPDSPEASWAFRVDPASRGVLNLRGERHAEAEADRLGLFLLAEAGFHPEYAVALDRFMRAALGDQTKYSLFLLNHPLWLSREQQSIRAEGIALAIFNQRWPNPAKSPGGDAPPIGKIQSVLVKPGTGKGALDLHVSFQLRNSRRRQVRVAARLLDRHRALASVVPAYAAPDGTFAVNSMLPALDRDTGEATISIPDAAVAVHGRQITAAVFLVADDWTIDLWLQPVLFP